MVLCPVALAIGCRKCPVFAVCPLKSTIGDYAPADAPVPTPPRAAKKGDGAKKPAAGNATAAAGRGAGGQRRSTRRRPT